jgi:hypothetical protein
MLDPGLSRHGDTPKMRPADETGFRTECKRLHNIGTATNAAINEHGNAAVNGTEYGWKRFHATDRTVELPSAMI